MNNLKLGILKKVYVEISNSYVSGNVLNGWVIFHPIQPVDQTFFPRSLKVT